MIPSDKHVAIEMQDIVRAGAKHSIEVTIEWASAKILERRNNAIKKIVCDLLSCLVTVVNFYNTALSVALTKFFEEATKRPNILMPTGGEISSARSGLNGQNNLRNLVMKSFDLMWRQMRCNLEVGGSKVNLKRGWHKRLL
jgi:hypothetical protein